MPGSNLQLTSGARFRFAGVGKNPPMPVTIDRRFGLPAGLELPERYAVRRLIASGGMASVWCARDRILGRSVAIKLISAPYAHDQAAVRRFKREARAAARLSSHRHVVTIYDVGQAVDSDDDRGRPFIVMEYLAGGTVADAWRVGAVTAELAVRWISQAAGAIDFAHSHGVIHRDIKPVNLLLDCERSVHVADFGIARLGAEDTFTGTGEMIGTAAYIAPEQVLGNPATEASDRYALAVAAFELLVGERPFTAENFAAQARQHLEDVPPAASLRNPDLPRAVDEVLRRGMAKQPEERWPTATAFAEAMARALGAPARRPAAPPAGPPRDAIAVAAPPSPPVALRPAAVQPPRRRRAPALAALAAAVIGLAAAVVVSGALSRGGHPAAKQARASASHRHRRATHATNAKRAPTSAPKSAATTASTVTATQAAATTPAPTADSLQARGHELLGEGRYAEAATVLRQAVRAASPGTLTYAYALFDLGRSLRLSGDPAGAAKVLWQRLQIPNQTGVVREELQLALRALGARARHG